MGTDRDWQSWGERDPYFGVLSHERFRRRQLTPEALEDFFRIGRAEMLEILAEARGHFAALTMRRTLDFGCGVGRLLIPLAEVSEQCVGVDVSAAMRAEAASNCARFGRANVVLVADLEDPAAARGGFTFINSYIVLQHIAPRRGLDLIARLLALLESGGCAALHVTFGRGKYTRTLGAQPLGRRIERRLRRPLLRLGRSLAHGDPEMQMNTYDMNRVLYVAQQCGVRSGGLRFTDHAGHLGVILFLYKASHAGAVAAAP